MDFFSGYIWIFLSKLVQTLFWVFHRITMRCCSHEAINSACSSNLCHENYKTETNNSKTKIEAESCCSSHSVDAELICERFEEGIDIIHFQQEYIQSYENDSNGFDTNYAGNLGLEEEETTKLVFKFQYQIRNYSEEFNGVYSESFDSLDTDSDIDKSSTSSNKYELISGKSFYLLDEQEHSSFNFKEPCVCMKIFPMENDSDFLSEINFNPESCERRCINAAEKLETVSSIEQFDEHQGENLNNNVSNTDFGITIELNTTGNNDEENAVLTKEDLDFEVFDGEDGDKMDEIRKLEETRMPNSDMENIEKLKGHCFQDRHVNAITLHGSTVSDLEDCHKYDAQWEYQELIEQLKVELNKVKATGLPTIFENCESPRIMEDLKPWKIDENFQHEHGSAIKELPKFYKSYIEQMRNFDILNYQKFYAIGSLKTKDLLQSYSSRNNSSPAITSFLPHIFHHSRHKKSEYDPLKKFMREFYSDLENAYVGQLCLSWEFLQWEYEKAMELWESDQFRLQSYNEVAGEFQQFQVLLQRFMENEPFQGPRVEYYVRNRCVMQNLLQVPVIREDSIKEEKKLKTRYEDKDEITSDILVEILEESIRIMWHFIRADKDASSLTHKGPRKIQVELQDPADSKFRTEIQSELQKKEKKLKEFFKSKNSILKKFQKHEENGRDHLPYFFSQVDMKLVWRVLNMSKITRDQLAWCGHKLNNISFSYVNRRIHVEPSFLLFPC